MQSQIDMDVVPFLNYKPWITNEYEGLVVRHRDDQSRYSVYFKLHIPVWILTNVCDRMSHRMAGWILWSWVHITPIKCMFEMIFVKPENHL
jgi:hypothetical protein